jgi:O-antigen/teichoic acid export membrane protein
MRVLDFVKARVLGSRFLSSGAIVLAGGLFVNILNYTFTLVISRLVGVAVFGEVSALIGLSLIVSVPASALTLLVAREASIRKAADEHDLIPHVVAYIRKNTFLLALVLWLGMLLLLPYLEQALHIARTPFLIFSLIIPITLFASIQLGAFQGLQNFSEFVVQNSIVAFIKLFGSILLVLAGYALSGVVTALVLGYACGLVFGFFALRKKFKKRFKKATATDSEGDFHAHHHTAAFIKKLRGPLLRAYPALLLTTLLLALLSNVDVVLAKHYLSDSDAGLYGALSTIGSIIVYGITAFVTVMLPMAAESHARKGKSGQVLALSLSFIAFVAICAVLFFSLFPTFIVWVMFGARYLSIAPYLGLYAVAMLFEALSIALANYSIAINNRTFLVAFLAGIALELGLVALYHSTIGAVVMMVVISSAALFVLLALNYFIFCRSTSAATK